MIQAPILGNDFIRTYIETLQTSVSVHPEIDLPEIIVFSFDLDYHNFVILATLLGQAFHRNRLPQAVQEGISFFSDNLRENVFSVAMRKFYAQMEEERENGPLCEMHFACQTHLITLYDLLHMSFKRGTETIKYHGGKDATLVFNDYVKAIAANCFINIQINISISTWSMFSHHGNSRTLFFETEASQALFDKLLTPLMKIFYTSMKI